VNTNVRKICGSAPKIVGHGGDSVSRYQGIVLADDSLDLLWSPRIIAFAERYAGNGAQLLVSLGGSIFFISCLVAPAPIREVSQAWPDTPTDE
jgi:hypothetical protein